MSKWISGKEALENLDVKDFEFIDDFVDKGLQPHSDKGQPIFPVDVADKLLKEKQEQLVYHSELAYNLLASDREELAATRIASLEQEIEKLKKIVDSAKDKKWQDFEFSESDSETELISWHLLDALYLKDDIEKIFGKPFKKVEKKVPTQEKSKDRKIRPDQRCRLLCRKIAQQFWDEDSTITIADMIKKKEIIEVSKKSDGTLYQEDTVRNWIKDLCPNRSPGRRYKKAEK